MVAHLADSWGIFVHNLGPLTTDDSLRHHFSSRYGAVEDAYIIPNRGFGFVHFESQASASAVLEESHQFIDGWPASCCLRYVRMAQQDNSDRTVVIWGIKPGLDPYTFLEFFRQFGETEAGPLGMDRETGELKPTVTLVYKTRSGAEAATRNMVLQYGDRTFYCRMAGPAFLGPQLFGSSTTGNAAVGEGYNQNRHFQAQFPNPQQQSGQVTTTNNSLFCHSPAELVGRRQSHYARRQVAGGRGGGGTGVYLGGYYNPPESSGQLDYRNALLFGSGGERPRFGGPNAQQQVVGGGGPVVRGEPGPSSQYQQMGGNRPPPGQLDFPSARQFGSGGGRQGAPTWSWPPSVGGYGPR